MQQSWKADERDKNIEKNDKSGERKKCGQHKRNKRDKINDRYAFRDVHVSIFSQKLDNDRLLIN